MELGWLDFCLRVDDFDRSRAFYEALGFRLAEGGENWGVFVLDTARIGLFGRAFMDEDAFSLNFRGGDLPRIRRELAERGLIAPEGQAGAIRLRDPDGNLVFIDSAPGETMKVPQED